MRKLWLHLLFWLVFYLMWSRVLYFYIDNPFNRLYFSALDVSLVMLAFYGIYALIMPHYFRHKNLALLLATSGLLIVGLSGVYAGIMRLFLRERLVAIHFDFSWTYQDLQDNRFFIALLGVLGGCFVKLALDRIDLSKRMEQLEKENSLAELTSLKAQLNPHFLFNALNGLYAQLDLHSAQAKETLTALADLLRYQLYAGAADQIPVAQEIAYLTNYVHLQRMRLDNCRCELTIDEPPNGLIIAPLLLIPFIENAFKHVSDFEQVENHITVRGRFEGDRLLFSCINTKEDQPTEIATPSGIGLINVKKRLVLVYGPDHSLVINDSTPNLYTVQLQIRLNYAKLSDR